MATAPTPSRRSLLLGAAALPALARAALAQGNWPDRPIRVIVPFGAGTSTDIMTRLVTPRMSQELGQPIVIENRPGAGGVVGSEAVAKSLPDGYSLTYPDNTVYVVGMDEDVNTIWYVYLTPDQ